MDFIKKDGKVACIQGKKIHNNTNRIVVRKEVMMSRLPILQELFQSKDIFLFVIGIGVSVVFSYFWKQLKWCLIGTFVSFGIYLFCEMTAPKVVSYAEAFGILFLGWFCLGSTFGFLVCDVLKVIQKKRKEGKKGVL